MSSSPRPWIPILPESDASPELQAMYDRVRDPRGHVDNILSIHSLRPASLESHWRLYRDAMVSSRDLSRVQREMIAVVVSAANQCEY
jgi:alkylhydroperoxidase family enzyme